MEEGPAKATLAVSLAALLLNSSESEISEENLSAVLKASGVDVSSGLCAQWAEWIDKAGGVKQFLQGPCAGGGGGGAAPAAGNDAPAAAPQVVEEEVEEIAGGTDMFGGGDDY